ncbi:unnamed protein product [Gadus morhua 'NCC']
MARVFGLLFLLFLAVILGTNAEASKKRRRKREWILPPAMLMEGKDYTNREYIAKIRSDMDVRDKVEYSLTGEGADKPPYNRFTVDAATGFVRIHDILDREERACYNLLGIAKYRNGSEAEDHIPLRVIVGDVNDNEPTIRLHEGNTTESSEKGTFIMQVEGEDADEEGTVNAKMAYAIINQEPKGHGNMFNIDRHTGKLYVKEPTLDRETIDFYTLTIEATDMGGAKDGNKGTGSVKIKVLDINDNVPELEQEEYDGTVDENVADVVVMRIKAIDKDLEHTGNWLAVFNIIQGNEDGLFSIETDNKTNEGILKLIKAVDFEELQKLELGLNISNVNPFISGIHAVSMEVPVEIGAGGPVAAEDGVIVAYPATDPDTGKNAENVRYAKIYDPDNWVSIDGETAEIRLNKVPDRESKFIVNGSYVAKILCMTQDNPSKTSTGTIAIHVFDSNDHCPTLTTRKDSLCSDEKTVYITGFDEDVKPNGAPLSFRIVPEGTRGDWDIEIINETTAALHSHEWLWPGVYKLEVEVADEQGLSCPDNEEFELEVCTCGPSQHCVPKTAERIGQTTSTQLSAPALGLLLSVMCLLLFIPLLLLFCQCGGANYIFPEQFADLPFDAKEHLISYHTEGKGDDKEVPLQSIPIMMGSQKTKGAIQAKEFNMVSSTITASHETNYESRTHNANQSLMDVDNAFGTSSDPFDLRYASASFSGHTMTRSQMHASDMYEEIALPDIFLDDYYSQKAQCALPMKDSLLVFDYEGQGSPAGSVGSGSLVESDDDLQFLDDLGAKFKTLSEICIPKMPEPPASKVEHVFKQTVNRTIETPIVKPKIEHGNKTIDVKMTTVNKISSASNVNISKSSRNTLNTSRQSQKQSPSTSTSSQVTNVKNIQSAPFSPPGQMVMYQQQPIYYATMPMMQPLQYIPMGQPQLQNMLFAGSATGSVGAQSVFVVNGSQNPLPGMVMNDVKGSAGSSVVSSSAVSPTVFALPGSPGSPSWNMIAPGAGGAYTFVEAKISSSGAQGLSPLSAHGTLPGGELVGPTMMQGNPNWNLTAPGAGGAYTLVETKLSSREAQGLSSVSSQGTLPRGELVSPTILMQGSPSLNLMAPGAGGAYTLVETKLSSREAQGLSLVSAQGTLTRGEFVSPTTLMQGSPSLNLIAPGSSQVSSQGNLPGGGNLVKEAAPPQWALSKAAKVGVNGILPEHTISTAGQVNVKNNVGVDLVGNTGEIMLESCREVVPCAKQSGEGNFWARELQIAEAEVCPADISHSVPETLISLQNELTPRPVDTEESAQTFESSDTNLKKKIPLDNPVHSNTEICEPLEDSLEFKRMSISERKTLEDDVSLVVIESTQHVTPTSVMAVSGEFKVNIQESLSDVILQETETHTLGEENADHGSPLNETMSNQQKNQIPEEPCDQLTIIQSPITEEALMGIPKEEPELLLPSPSLSEDAPIVAEVSPIEGSLDLADMADSTLLLTPEDELGLPVKYQEILQYQEADEHVVTSEANELILEKVQSKPCIPPNSNDSTAFRCAIECADDESEGFENDPKSRQIVENINEIQASALDEGVNIEDKAIIAPPLNQIDTDTEKDSQEASDSEENAMPELQLDQRLEDNMCKGHAIEYFDEVNAKATSLQNRTQLNTVSDDQREDCDSDCMLESAQLIADESIEEEVKGSLNDMTMLEQYQHTVDITGICSEKTSLELNIAQNVAMKPDMHLSIDEVKEGSLTSKLDSPVPQTCSDIKENDTKMNVQVEEYNMLAEKLDSDAVEYQELPK